MIKTILKYGALSGLALVAYLNICYITGITYSQTWVAWLATLAIALVPVAVFLALRELKKKQYNGRLPFLPALVAGFTVSILGALVYCVFAYIDIHYLDMRQNREMIELTVEGMKERGKSGAEIEQKVQKMQAHYFSWKPYTNTLIWYARMGVIYASAAWLLLNIKQLKLYAKNKTNGPDNSA